MEKVIKNCSDRVLEQELGKSAWMKNKVLPMMHNRCVKEYEKSDDNLTRCITIYYSAVCRVASSTANSFIGILMGFLLGLGFLCDEERKMRRKREKNEE